MSILTHDCPEQPEEVEVLVILGQDEGYVVTLISLRDEKPDIYAHDARLYGVKFCPYCGAKLVSEEPL